MPQSARSVSVQTNLLLIKLHVGSIIHEFCNAKLGKQGKLRNSYGIATEFALQTRRQNWRRMQNQFFVGKECMHSPILQRPKCRKKTVSKAIHPAHHFLQLPKYANYFFKITNDFASTVAGSVALSVGVPLETSTAFV